MTETSGGQQPQFQERPPAASLPTNPAVVGQVDANGNPVPLQAPDREISPVGAPSAVRTQKDLAQVMVDQWGHRGEFIRGMIIRLADLNPAHYDLEHALSLGVIRLLSEAEARVWRNTASSTSPTNADGSLDEAHRDRSRFDAGIPTEIPETVTTAQGQPEPAEFSKPTIAFTGDNQPSPRPVRVVGEAGSDQADSGTPGKPSASDLVAQAKAAQTTEELDRIDSQADNRMTSVHDAVSTRRAELAQQG